ncbi:DUF2023 family protein [Dysgonomonas sp. Marseille-P4677]|uniref:DUF2023 family protein n=1 Tax=Dysgonomonas sp. Marseille-P4677 TaxID=2364790 RepID=UPI001912707B|nr:DUF2023 family protein [Dysgonomonas sp. Marseille-P4677]MBK5719747.1 DUF2023 family protein [Dysgonomonas sp. Marseille-P4677]
MRVFYHLIYEYKKGVRDLVLYTLTADAESKAIWKLEKNAINYKIQRLKNGNINVFFGKEECLTVVSRICGEKALNQLTPEEDFILGILLGYSISEQCSRYCRKQKDKNILCLA